MRNPYEVLGVARDADDEKIHKAYTQLAMKFHPDRNEGDESAAARFREAAEAYAFLSNPEKRAAFDRSGAPIRSVQDLFSRGAGLRVMRHYLPRAPLAPILGEDFFLLVKEPTDGSRVVELFLPASKGTVSIELPISDVTWGEAVGLGNNGGNLFLKIQRTREVAP